MTTQSPEAIRAAVMEARHALVAALSHVFGVSAFLSAIVVLEYLSAASLPAWRAAISGTLHALRSLDLDDTDAADADLALAAAKEVERRLDVLFASLMADRWPEDARAPPGIDPRCRKATNGGVIHAGACSCYSSPIPSLR